jgi:cytochrome c556
MIAPILAALSVVLTIVACETPGGRTEDPLGMGRSPSRHAVHSARLQEVMGGLRREVSRLWPQEVAEERAADTRRDRERQLREAGQLADALAEAAAQMPNTISDVELSEADRKAFLAGAAKLQTHADELRTSARREDLGQMQRALRKIQTTCTGCHDQFAELAGPIRFGRSG